MASDIGSPVLLADALTALATLQTAVNQLVADSLLNRKLLNAALDALQAAGISL